jgi:hypothetical protein
MGPIAPVLGIISTVASIGGTVLGVMAANQQGKYQEAVAKAQAKAANRQANEVTAQGQREAVVRAKQARLVQSRINAVASAGGGNASDPTILQLMGGVGGEGALQVANTISDAKTQGGSLNYQADIYKMQGAQAAAGRKWDVAGAILGGVSNLAGSWASKYGY